MKKLVLVCIAAFAFHLAQAQPITITMNDMPAVGDSLRSSAVNPVSVNMSVLTQTGANTTWDFTNLIPISQTLDEFKSAASVNFAYGIVFGASAYGYKVPDDFLGQALPVSDIYLFFQKRITTPQRFVQRGFGASMSGSPLPLGLRFKDEDEWFYLPLNYTDVDNSTYLADTTILGNRIKIEGTRQTTVDGWGLIKTPYAPNGVPCLRIRTVADEIDTIQLSGGPAVGTPRKVIDYKWLAAGEHYPMLWITTNEVLSVETITSVRFRDYYRPALGIENIASSFLELKAYPNPATADVVSIQVPKAWRNYSVALFDMQGRVVLSAHNTSQINLSACSSGQYFVRVTCGSNLGYVTITK